jgi:hypothetical protein
VPSDLKVYTVDRADRRPPRPDLVLDRRTPHFEQGLIGRACGVSRSVKVSDGLMLVDASGFPILGGRCERNCLRDTVLATPRDI